MGVVVVSAAGNRGSGGLLAPGDAEAVITVGSVAADGVHSSFSSVGPTDDWRIKPDLSALGEGVWCAAADVLPNGVKTVKGTSFSTPFVAGAAALLLEANPEWRPAVVKRALTRSCARPGGGTGLAPDWYLGYGVLDIAAAFDHYDDDAFNVCPALTLITEVVRDPGGGSASDAGTTVSAGGFVYGLEHESSSWRVLLPPVLLTDLDLSVAPGFVYDGWMRSYSLLFLFFFWCAWNSTVRTVIRIGRRL